VKVGMAWLRTHTRQWYILAVLLGVIALAFFHGTAHDVLFSVAVFAFLGACIRDVGLLVRDNDVARGMIGRGADSGGFASAAFQLAGKLDAADPRWTLRRSSSPR